MGVVVYTAILGPRTDALRAPLVVDRHARYVCFSDRPVHVPPYEWVSVPAEVNPRLASRRYKILADHPALDGATRILWHDASYRLLRNVEWVREYIRNGIEIAAFRHAKKKRTLEDEARKIVKYGYLDRETATAHVLRYRAAGFDHTDAVTCGGLLARIRTPKVAAFNALWWDEMQRWGGRDQASLDYSAWASGVVVGHLKGRVKRNEFAQWRLYELAVPA